MVAQPSGTAEVVAPFSPAHPAPDPDHEQRTAIAIERALRQIPFYLKRGHATSTSAARDRSLADTLRSLPLLLKKDIRATLPKQWVPAERNTRAELESGALELVETSGSTGDRLRILWDEGWWMRQESRGMRTNPVVAAAMDGAHGVYRESVLTTPACGLDTCHVGDLPYEERKDESHLFLNTRTDPLFWTPEEQTRMLDELALHSTVGLESDPLYLALLARFAKGAGRRIDVKGFVQLTYAFTTRAYRRAIAEVFSGPILQLYGASEVGVMFMEGDDATLHHCPFTTHVELLRARVPTPGAEDVALAVVTTLDRLAMPLVRFVVGDLVQVKEGGPRHWTNVSPLASVEGRLDDAMLRPDGAIVTAGAIDRALASVDGLVLWQANQRTADAVELDVVPSGDGSRVVEEVRARVAPLLRGLKLTARSATAIPIESSGKFRVAKRHFPLDLARSFEGCEGVSA
jgi:phenylacetate-coenzyme A ligase PaaK-like adenylate-forming protein